MIRHSLAIMFLAIVTGPSAAADQIPTSQPTSIIVRPILSAQEKREADIRLVDRFMRHVEQSGSFSPTIRHTLTEAWEQHRRDPSPAGFLLAGLSILSESIHAALSALDNEDYEKADDLLRSAIASKDPYISLHARTLLARSLVEQNRLEEAEVLLNTLATEEPSLTQLSDAEVEVDFLLGYCQLANLRYGQAQATLERFEKQHPGAPDQYRLPARQMLQELRIRQGQDLGEVSDLMAYTGRRLSHGDMSAAVQTKQDRIVALLDQLIEQAETKEKQAGQKCQKCGGKGCQACKGTSPGSLNPNSPAQMSQLPEGSGRMGDLRSTNAARPGEAWGQMRPEERKRILQSVGQHFPSQYRQLVEQYYRQLAKEN